MHENFPSQTCRARHYECKSLHLRTLTFCAHRLIFEAGDRTQPVCRRCSDSGRTCVPAFNVRFRRRRTIAADAGLHSKGKLIFGREQEWVQTPKTCMFTFRPEFAPILTMCSKFRRRNTESWSLERTAPSARQRSAQSNRFANTVSV